MRQFEDRRSSNLSRLFLANSGAYFFYFQRKEFYLQKMILQSNEIRKVNVFQREKLMITMIKLNQQKNEIITICRHALF